MISGWKSMFCHESMDYEKYITEAFGHYRRRPLPEPTGTYVERQLPWFLIGFTSTTVLAAIVFAVAFILV